MDELGDGRLRLAISDTASAFVDGEAGKSVGFAADQNLRAAVGAGLAGPLGGGEDRRELIFP